MLKLQCMFISRKTFIFPAVLSFVSVGKPNFRFEYCSSITTLLLNRKVIVPKVNRQLTAHVSPKLIQRASHERSVSVGNSIKKQILELAFFLFRDKQRSFSTTNRKPWDLSNKEIGQNFGRYLILATICKSQPRCITCRKGEQNETYS